MSLTRKQKKRLLIGAMTGIVVIAVMIIVFVTGHTNDKNKDIIDLTDTSKPKATSTPAPTVSPTPTPTPTPSPTPVPKDYSRIDEFLESITSGDIFYTKGEILKLMEGNFPEDEIEYASKHYPYSDDESAERVIEEAKKSGLSKTGFKTYLESRGIDLKYFKEDEIDWNKQAETFRKLIKEQNPDMDDETIEAVMRAEGFED